jgi:hypothetical protein
MKNVLAFLLLAVLSLVTYGQKPETEIIIQPDSSYQIYQINKVPIGTLKYVDKCIPLSAVNKAYRDGVAFYDSVVTACHYSYKNFWLKRSSDIKYSAAVYDNDTKRVEAMGVVGAWPESSAYEIYFLLFAVIILFFSLLFGSKGDYDGWDVQNDSVFGLSFGLPLAICLGVNLLVYFNLGRNPFSLFVFSAAFFVLILSLIKTIKANWSKKRYLNFQKIILLSTILSLGVITHSIIFPVIIAALFLGILRIFIPITFRVTKTKTEPASSTIHKFVDEEY